MIKPTVSRGRGPARTSKCFGRSRNTKKVLIPLDTGYHTGLEIIYRLRPRRTLSRSCRGLASSKLCLIRPEIDGKGERKTSSGGGAEKVSGCPTSSGRGFDEHSRPFHSLTIFQARSCRPEGRGLLGPLSNPFKPSRPKPRSPGLRPNSTGERGEGSG